MDIKIIVAVHKEYWMPLDSVYLPLFVGAIGKNDIHYQRDDEGENISYKNPFYCELTGLYWAWKNMEDDYIGLVHYRRYFAGLRRRPGIDVRNRILSGDECAQILKNTDIIVPRKRYYFIETLYSHYAHTHYGEHLDAAREILQQYYPDYLDEFDHCMKQRGGHMFNMMIMKRELLDEYCQWLFFILRKLEEVIDYRNYNSFQARLFGRISELLFNVWLSKKKYAYSTLPVVNMEKVQWRKKAIALIKAKYQKEKYERSF